jgi:hypothetical protein
MSNLCAYMVVLTCFYGSPPPFLTGPIVATPLVTPQDVAAAAAHWVGNAQAAVTLPRPAPRAPRH